MAYACKEELLSMVFRNKIRGLILDFLGFFSTPAPGVHILNGHRTQGEAEPETFRKLLSELSKTVKFVKVEEAVRMIVTNDLPDYPCAAFTFDDGFDDCYHIFAPVLEEFGVNALMFINPNYVDGNDSYIENFNNINVRTPGKLPMRWKQLKDLQNRGFVIGAHTMDHYMTAKDDEEELRYQIVECKNVIEEKLGCPCEYFAWPYGKIEHTSHKAVEMACDTYKYVFSQTDYRHYFSFNGRVINRRHFEPFWPVSHVKYFISRNKK